MEKYAKDLRRHECRPLCPPSDSGGKSELDADALLRAAVGGRPFTPLPHRMSALPTHGRGMYASAFCSCVYSSIATSFPQSNHCNLTPITCPLYLRRSRNPCIGTSTALYTTLEEGSISIDVGVIPLFPPRCGCCLHRSSEREHRGRGTFQLMQIFSVSVIFMYKNITNNYRIYKIILYICKCFDVAENNC